MKKRAIVVEKAPGRISLALDTGNLPAGCCGSLAMADAGAPALTPGSEGCEPQGTESACAACSTEGCSRGRLFPQKGRNAELFTFDVDDSSAWRLGQEAWLEFPATSMVLSTLVSIVLPLGLAWGAFALLTALLPALPKGLAWLASLLVFAGAAWLSGSAAGPRISGRGVKLSGGPGAD